MSEPIQAFYGEEADSLIEGFRSRVAGDTGHRLMDMKVYLTKRCNQRCKMCVGWTKQPDEADELTTADFVRCLSEGAALGLRHVTLFGGEPTIRPDLCEIVGAASELGIVTELVTNGYLLTDDLAEALVRAGLCEILFSLDCVRPDMHDYIRGVAGSFDRLVRGMESVRKWKRRLGSYIVPITHSVVMKETFRYLPELVRFAYVHGIEEVALSPMMPPFGLTDEKNPFHPIHHGLNRSDISEYYASVLPRILQAASECGYSFLEDKLMFYGTTAEEIEWGANFEYSRRFLEQSPCYTPFLHLSLWWTGDVLPCNKLRSTVLGNIRQTALSDIWESASLRDVRRQCQAKRGYKHAECRGCSYHVSRRQVRLHRLMTDADYREAGTRKGISSLFPRYLFGSKFTRGEVAPQRFS